jgi:hypothetical protein
VSIVLKEPVPRSRFAFSPALLPRHLTADEQQLCLHMSNHGFRIKGCKLLVFDVKVKEGSRGLMHSNSGASEGQEEHFWGGAMRGAARQVALGSDAQAEILRSHRSRERYLSPSVGTPA